MSLLARGRHLVRRSWSAFDGLASDTLWSTALEGTGAVTALISFYLLTKVLDPVEYGPFIGLYSLAATFSAITFSGPGLALVQRRIRYNQPLDEILRSFLSLALIGGLASTAIAIVLALFIIDLGTAEIVLVVASELFAYSIIFVCSWLVQIAEDYAAMTRVRLVAVLLKLAAVPVLYGTGNLTIRNLGLSYLVLYGAWAAWLIFRRLPAIGYTLRFGPPPANAWRSSAVFATPLAAMQLQVNGDKVVLNAFDLKTDAGLYGAAYRVVLLAAMPIRVIGQAAFHRFLPEGDAEVPGYHLRKAGRLTGVMFVVGLAAAGAIYVVLYLLTPLIDLIINDGYQEAKDIIPWLALFIPLQAMSGTPLNGLLGLGRTRERAAVYLSSSVISMTLYLILIPRFGWQGAVAATLGSELYLASASWLTMVHYQRIADRELMAKRREAEVALS